MDEMEIDPKELKKRKERAEQDSHPVHQLPLCLACKVRNHMKREAARLCHGCNLPYCVECYRLSHRKGREKFHRWTNYEHKLVTCAVEETRKVQDYDDQLLKHLERVNPRQYRRKKAITKFRWTDGLLQVAGQIFLDRDPHNTGELDMGDTIELIRELLKKRADEMPVVRVAVRHGWKFMDYDFSITFLELVHFVPYYDSYFKHQMMEKLKITNSGDKLGFDPAIFM